jgi:hypothetical protein
MKLLVKVVEPKGEKGDFTDRNVSIYEEDGKFICRRLHCCAFGLRQIGLHDKGIYHARVCTEKESTGYLEIRYTRRNEPYYVFIDNKCGYIGFISGSNAGDTRADKLFNNESIVFINIKTEGRKWDFV